MVAADPARQRALVDVRVLALRGDEVLLIQPIGEVFGGCWNLPGGHVMPGEDVVSAAVRDLEEEVGLRARPEDLVFNNVTHHRPPMRSEKVTFTFSARIFDGEAFPREPTRARVTRWTSWSDLPTELMPQAAASLSLFRAREHFDTFGLGRVSGPVISPE